MSIFCYKNLEANKPLGLMIKTEREKAKLNITELSKKTRVPEKYIKAIEEENFTSLPQAKSHIIAYVKSVCSALNIDCEDAIYQIENDGILSNLNCAYMPNTIKTNHALYVFLRYASVGITALALLSFIVWQIANVTTPPKLSVYSPVEGFISDKNEILLQGETEKECVLTVNGEEIQIDETGKFNKIITMSAGVNTITLSSKKKHGKTTTVIRHIVVQEKKTQTSF